MENVVKVLVAERKRLAEQLQAVDKAIAVLGNGGIKPVARRSMSDATKAKLRASAKKRWAKVKKAA